jgi:flagellar hook-basal body complex protein FliE
LNEVWVQHANGQMSGQRQCWLHVRENRLKQQGKSKKEKKSKENTSFDNFLRNASGSHNAKQKTKNKVKNLKNKNLGQK